MEYSKKQRKEDIDNRGISVAKSKLVLFLVVGIVVLVLSSSGEVFAQETSEPKWELVETVINHENKPTEFIVGVTPGYYSSPRYDGTFDKYTIGETYFLHKRRVMDRGVSIATAKSVLRADCEMRADFTKPPEILVPGKNITLKATVSGTGTSPGIGSLIQFTYGDEGINLRNETSVSTGSGGKPPFSTRSISPSFVVPKTHSGEISIVAFLWNVGAANVRWVYRAQDSTPSEEEEENCEEYCKTISGANIDRAIWDGISDYPNCGCICEKGWEMKEAGCVACDDICKEKGEHYVYDPDESDDNICECKCEEGYESDYYDEKCEKVECPPNSTNVVDLAGSCPKDRKLNRHCCCDEGYINYMGGGVCIKKEDVPGTVVCGKWGCQEGEDCFNCPEDCICAPGICDPFSEYADPETKCSPKVAYIFISSDLNCILHYYGMHKINELKGRYRSLGYKTIVVRVNGLNDVIVKLSNPSTKAMAYFGHGDFPSLEGYGAMDIRNGMLKLLNYKYFNIGMSNAEVRQRAGERSLHPNLDYAYIHTCHSLDDNTLANYLLRSGGTYWGMEGLLISGEGLDEYVRP